MQHINHLGYYNGDDAITMNDDSDSEIIETFIRGGGSFYTDDANCGNLDDRDVARLKSKFVTGSNTHTYVVSRDINVDSKENSFIDIYEIV